MLRNLLRTLHPRYQKLFLEYKVNFRPRYGYGKPPHRELYELINKQRPVYEELLHEFLKFKTDIHRIKPRGGTPESPEPEWNNGFLPGLDIIAIYCLLAMYRPKIYAEIGSGNSTRVAAKVKKELDLNMQIVSIDPAPRAGINALSDRIIREPFENISFDFLFDLGKDDVLFVDNSHRVLPNSDAMVFFMEVLPKLKPGVLVQIHDVYLPYDYPQFMCDRFYSEQYALAFFLLAAPEKYRPVFPGYFISEDAALSSLLLPFWDHPNLKDVERHGGSFWFRIV